MSWEKNSKKKPMIANKFCFLVDFIRPTGPMVNMVTRYTGGLSQLLLVKMSWGKNSKEKPIIEKLNTSTPFPPRPPTGCQGGEGVKQNKIVVVMNLTSQL